MSQDQQTPVILEQHGAIAVITMSNPPLNTLSHSVRLGLDRVLTKVITDSEIKGAVLCGEGRAFCAGADVREFDQAPQTPSLPDVIRLIEACPKPVVALIHGVAFGGGLELALGCHYRLAGGGARLALPEVKLGLIPGAGGTQRLPRLVGIDVAIDLVTSGRPVEADEAAALGLVDAIIEGDEIKFAIDFVNRGSPPLPVPLSQRALPESPPTQVFAEKRAGVVRRARGQQSPLRALESIEYGLSASFEEGLRNERAVFQGLRKSSQSRALRHAFFAERAVAKIPGLENTHPRDIQHLGIVGGGTMGIGIAVCALKAGFNVVLLERTLAESARARAGIEAGLQAFVERDRMTSSDHTAARQRLVTDTDYACLSTTELIIEAVFEDMEIKKEVFRQLDEHAPDGTILATNTSYLNTDEIAAVTSRPEDVIGLHFFSPAQLMRLLEIVKGEKTGSHVVATCLAFARRLDKVGVLAGVCDGFIGNRILFHYRKQVDYMLEDGAMPWEIDQAMESFGMAMGPFRVMDQAGLDIGWANRQRLAPTRAQRERYVEIADRLCERGWFGRKSGRGWYVYQADGTVLPNSEVEQIVHTESARHGIKRRFFSVKEIQNRVMLAMINEAARVLEEGIALRPLDVDMVKVFGYGFPRWRGGPMHFADETGLDEILKLLRDYAMTDDFFWNPSSLLERLVREGRTFSDLN